jgi:hypothetical protein
MASFKYTFTSGDTITPARLNDARDVFDIVNTDIKSDAAIAGTKIAPNFGSQNVATTGNASIGTTSTNARLTIQGTGSCLELYQSVPSIRFASSSNRTNNYFIGANISDSVDGGMYLGTGSDVATGTCRLFIKSDGKVGVGTIDPTYTMSLVGSGEVYLGASNGTINGVYGASSSNGTAVLGTTTNHALMVVSNNTERMRVDASGNVGVATVPTTGSASKLFVGGDITRVGGIGAFALNLYFDSGQSRWEYAGAGTGAALIDVGSGAYSFRSTGSTSGTVGNEATLTEHIRISSNGFIGFTNANPQYRVDVTGTVNASVAYRVDATQVVSNRVTGWGAPTGTISRSALTLTAAATYSQSEMNAVIQALKAVITDLRTHGLIGN